MSQVKILLPGGTYRALRGRAVLPGGVGGLQGVLQQRELRGVSVRV